MIAFTKSGRAIALEEASASGSEGSIRVVSDEPWMVAKIYHPDSAGAELRQKKVEVMAGAYPILCGKAGDTMKKMAWPVEALYREPDATDFCGFLMKRAKGEPLTLACQPSAGAEGMRRSLLALEELCAVTEFLHGAGICLGDWNPSNILVDESGHLELIDVDGFHMVYDYDEDTVYPCNVCAEGYVAPELFRAQREAGTDYGEMALAGTTTFTEATDNFGLAVTIFRTLNSWVHPFEGSVVLAAGEDYRPPKPIDELVEEGRSPFMGDSDLKLKPWALPLDMFPELFKKAFVLSLFSGDAEYRLDPASWRYLLADYRGHLIECACGKHVYHMSLSDCPYCHIEAHGNEGRYASWPHTCPRTLELS